MSSATSTVQGIKESLSKMLPAEKISEASQVESCRDMLQQLAKVDMTLEILSATLIGTVVSKLKAHKELGPAAKKLIKSWKAIAKSGGASDSKDKASGRSMERRDSTNSATASAEQEWSSLPSYRQNSCRKLHQFLLAAKAILIKEGVNESAVDHLAVSRATEIEQAIQERLGRDKTQYADKARSLCFNLKKNTQLSRAVILGEIEATELVNMTAEELASDAKKQEMQARAEKMMETTRLDWEQANESKINEMCGIKGDLLKASLFTCGRCKSVKTTSTQKQTRSADEPMTVFVLCLNCGKRWKC